MPSLLMRMSSTFCQPVNIWFSAKRNDSLGCCSVSVTSARIMLALTLYVLSSVISPDGTSMLTTLHGEALIYFTNDENPPASGLLMPEPKRPSMTSVSEVSCGGSNSCVTSMNSFIFLISVSRALFVAQSSDRWPEMLNRYTDML